MRPSEDLETTDGVFRNKVRIIQAVRGYRVSEDALLLTWFTQLEDNDFILDAGTGNGVIAFCLARTNRTAQCVGLEIQNNPALRAVRGARLNDLEERVFIVKGDLRQADRFFKQRSFSLVVSNPPYHEFGRGKINKLNEKALSRHQIMMPLSDLFRVSQSLLIDGGRLSIIYPATGKDLISENASETGFKMSRVLWIYPRVNLKPSLICVEAIQTQAKVKLSESNLELYGPDGIRTAKAQSIFSGSQIED
ncbi:MAG: methyltransferase [Syntrophaceae bacterium]|nr:methyltransferase [Syntrophaceae bacterium]